MKTIFYKVKDSGKGSSILEEMILYARKNNLGSVGSGIESLSIRIGDATYFSFIPGQIQHPSTTEKADAELVENFEKRLYESGKEWKRFDLENLLEKV